MSKFRKSNCVNVMADLRAFADYLEQRGDEGERTDAAMHLNRQLDPRGDHRS